MIAYTIGSSKSYNEYIANDKNPLKMGKTANYDGGGIWKTKEEISLFC